MIDVSFVLSDPLLSDTFDVRRQAESIGANGRASVGSEWFRDLIGVVTPQEPAGLERRDDGQFVHHEIMVQCEFALRDASFGYQPDVVLWGGREYLVTAAIPFQRMAGFTQARCVSTRLTDNPQ